MVLCNTQGLFKYISAAFLMIPSFSVFLIYSDVLEPSAMGIFNRFNNAASIVGVVQSLAITCAISGSLLSQKSMLTHLYQQVKLAHQDFRVSSHGGPSTWLVQSEHTSGLVTGSTSSAFDNISAG